MGQHRVEIPGGAVPAHSVTCSAAALDGGFSHTLIGGDETAAAVQNRLHRTAWAGMLMLLLGCCSGSGAAVARQAHLRVAPALRCRATGRPRRMRPSRAARRR